MTNLGRSGGMYKTKRLIPQSITYDSLVEGSVDLLDVIEKAFGLDGLGVLTVSGVPELSEKRAALLPLAFQFSSLPHEVKKQYEHSESYYSVGWSHGKENLQGRPDFKKGSYYANPLYDQPSSDPDIIRDFSHPNIWPKEDLPQLEVAFKDLGQLIFQVGLLLARQCDSYVYSQCPSYPRHRLEHTIRDSRVSKGRLLHYFPADQEEEGTASQQESRAGDTQAIADFSSWCGWHNDHGSLTGLTPAMYLDGQGVEADPTGDDDSGLYVLNRAGELVQVDMPRDHLAFQIGESAQIFSGGILQATPHAVKSVSMKGVSRETFACFLQPNWHEAMDPPDKTTIKTHIEMPSGVPSLLTRWKSGQTFGAFTAATLGAYY